MVDFSVDVAVVGAVPSHAGHEAQLHPQAIVLAPSDFLNHHQSQVGCSRRCKTDAENGCGTDLPALPEVLL
jgi:hypothetical protein